MATDRRFVFLCLLLLCSCGCFAPRGYLFTCTTTPYALPDDARSGRVGKKSCRIGLTQLKEPITQANLSVLWTDRAVAEAMQRAGMTEIRYADLQTLSVMNSVYERRSLVFYGE
ncbi:MAG TPA: hypothetical protein PKM57_01675 [Kiritimatiellia bacterium]|nr:hypothetical protein [Kiritimatiellia bacterium]HPS08547.1 hypothetical protein [Kiritimatiellia bacterium]